MAGGVQPAPSTGGAPKRLVQPEEDGSVVLGGTPREGRLSGFGRSGVPLPFFFWLSLNCFSSFSSASSASFSTAGSRVSPFGSWNTSQYGSTFRKCRPTERFPSTKNIEAQQQSVLDLCGAAWTSTVRLRNKCRISRLKVLLRGLLRSAFSLLTRLSNAALEPNLRNMSMSTVVFWLSSRICRM